MIFCIGETLAEREANKQNEVVKAELEGSVFNLSAEEFANVIVAYEPIWAIGTGKTATAEQAEEIHASFVRLSLRNMVTRWLKTLLFSMAVVLNPAMHPNCLLNLISTVVLSAVLH